MTSTILSIISGILGVAGFIISVINLIYFFAIRRKKLNIRFGAIGVSDYFNSNEVLKIQYFFENKSQLPISITRIQILIGNKLIDCERIPVVIEEVTRKRGNEIYDRDILKSKSIPININPLAAESGYFAFSIPQGTLSKSETALTFRICTNRGKAIQKTFVLHEDVLIR